MKLVVNNSFTHIKGLTDQGVRDFLTEALTYRNDIDAELASLYRLLKVYSKGSPKYKATSTKIDKLNEEEYVCWFVNDTFPTGLLNLVKEAISMKKAKFTVEDIRKAPQYKKILKWNNRPFKPRYYQKEAIDNCIAAERGVVVSAVGTGKSLMMAYLVKHFSVNTLIVVPSTGLLQQMSEDFKVWFGNQNVEIVDTKKVRAGKDLKTIRFITIQSLASLNKSGDLHKLTHDVDSIYIDEIHHAGSKSYTNLLSQIENIYYRFGFTGTFLRNDSKSLDMWGFLSNVLYRYTAKQAIDDGFLTPIIHNTFEVYGKKSKSYNKEYDNCYGGSQSLLQAIDQVIKANTQDQVLILVKKKDKAGAVINEFLKSQNISATYISGDDDKEYRNEAIKAFNSKKINILIGSTVIGEGIDIRSTDHLIFAQGGKSEIALVQAIGRLVRLFDGKIIGNLYDFNFLSTNYMSKHFTVRKNAVKRNFQPQKYKTLHL